MKKRIFLLALIFTAVALGGCGKSKEDSQKNEIEVIDDFEDEFDDSVDDEEKKIQKNEKEVSENFIDLTEVEIEPDGEVQSKGITIDKCKVVDSVMDTDSIVVYTISCIVNGEREAFDFKAYNYPDWGCELSDKVSLVTCDVDNDGDDEILANVIAIGNTLSDRTGELYIFKYNQGKFTDIYYMDVSDTPNGDWVLGYSATKGAVYYSTAKKESAEVIGTGNFKITFENGRANVTETDTMEADCIDF